MLGGNDAGNNVSGLYHNIGDARLQNGGCPGLRANESAHERLQVLSPSQLLKCDEIQKTCLAELREPVFSFADAAARPAAALVNRPAGPLPSSQCDEDRPFNAERMAGDRLVR